MSSQVPLHGTRNPPYPGSPPPPPAAIRGGSGRQVSAAPNQSSGFSPKTEPPGTQDQTEIQFATLPSQHLRPHIVAHGLDVALQTPMDENDGAETVFDRNQRAISAGEHEKSMSLAYAIRHYRRAMGWAIAMAALIVLEGYETSLMPNFFSYVPFRQMFGRFRHPDSLVDSSRVVVPEWQSAILSSGAACQLIGLVIAPSLANHLGYRKSAMLGLV